MITKTLIGPFGRAVVLLLALHGLPGCHFSSAPQVQLEAVGADVLVGDNLAFMLPQAYREVASAHGRAYQSYDGAKAKHDTIVIQRRETGYPAQLDEALETLLSRLEQLDHFDLLDVQLSHVGRHLALSYAADFEHLEVQRRQWGILIGTDTGILAMLMTSPKDTFHEATDGYLSLLRSLHVTHDLDQPANAAGSAHAQGTPP